MADAFTGLLSCPVFARDGPAGSLADVLFDDRTWRVKWLVIRTGPWLFSADVLISAGSTVGIDEETSRLHVDLTRQAIDDAPGIGLDLPLHAQKEIEMISHDDLMSDAPGCYGSTFCPPRIRDIARSGAIGAGRSRRGNPHLRSAEEIVGYQVIAAGGRLGRLRDLLLTQHLSRVDSLVVQSGYWWCPGRKQRIDPRSIGAIDWLQRRITLARSRSYFHRADTPGAIVPRLRAVDPAAIGGSP